MGAIKDATLSETQVPKVNYVLTSVQSIDAFQKVQDGNLHHPHHLEANSEPAAAEFARSAAKLNEVMQEITQEIYCDAAASHVSGTRYSRE